MIQLVYSWLIDEARGPWLLVLDNADSLETLFGECSATASMHNGMLQHLLPQTPNGSILITTRDKRVADRLTDARTSFKLDHLSHAEGEELLRSKLPFVNEVPQAEMTGLLEASDFLPLTITQACAFMREKDFSPSEYLGLFQKEGEEAQAVLDEDLGDLRRDLANGNSIIRTWKLSFENISQQNERAAQILSLMSMYDRQGIPIDLLRDPSDRVLGFKAAIALLSSFSLVTYMGDGNRLSLHRLVQLSIRSWLRYKDTESHWQEQALIAIASRIPSGEYESWPICASLLPHVQEVRKFTFDSHSSLLLYASLIQKIAKYDETQGRYADACMGSAKALEIYESIFGPQNIATLASASSLGSALRMRDMQAARQLHQRALEGRLRVLGANHCDTLQSMSDLASLLGNIGEPGASEDLNRRTLTGRESLLGKNDPETLVSKTNLAMVLDYQGKYEEAETLHRQVLSARHTIFGPKHPDTLASIRNLALVLNYQRKHEQANQLHMQALNGRAEVLGWKHPDTLASVSNYADILKYEGRLEECEMTNRWVLGQRKTILGAQHNWTLFSLGNLADVLRAQGLLEQAEEANREALNGYFSLGLNHAHTLKCASNLASILEDRTKYGEAEEMHNDVLKRRSQALGLDHPATKEAYHKLCKFYEKRNETENLNELKKRWERSQP